MSFGAGISAGMGSAVGPAASCAKAGATEAKAAASSNARIFTDIPSRSRRPRAPRWRLDCSDSIADGEGKIAMLPMRMGAAMSHPFILFGRDHLTVLALTFVVPVVLALLT